MHQFSKEDLISYVYEEINLILKVAIDISAKTDKELAKEIKTLKKQKEEMSKITTASLVSASKESINKVLAYAKQKKK